jgi:hypothetical protein
MEKVSFFVPEWKSRKFKSTKKSLTEYRIASGFASLFGSRSQNRGSAF